MVLLRRSLTTFLVISWAGLCFAQQTKVPQEVWRTLQEKGRVRVLVLLNMPWKSEGELTEDGISAQRKAIAANQLQFLSKLKGTRHNIIRQFNVVPAAAMEVEFNALWIGFLNHLFLWPEL